MTRLSDVTRWSTLEAAAFFGVSTNLQVQGQRFDGQKRLMFFTKFTVTKNKQILDLFFLMIIFCGLYHGKSPVRHHLGE